MPDVKKTYKNFSITLAPRLSKTWHGFKSNATLQNNLYFLTSIICFFFSVGFSFLAGACYWVTRIIFWLLVEFYTGFSNNLMFLQVIGLYIYFIHILDTFVLFLQMPALVELDFTFRFYCNCFLVWRYKGRVFDNIFTLYVKFASFNNPPIIRGSNRLYVIFNIMVLAIGALSTSKAPENAFNVMFNQTVYEKLWHQ